MKLIFIMICSILLNVSSFALSKSEAALVQKYEKELLLKADQEKISNNKRFYLYLIAARDFKSANLDKYYLKYLELAYDLKTTENKHEVYWRLINYHRKDNVEKSKNLLRKWQKENAKATDLMAQAFQVLALELQNKKLTLKEQEILLQGPFSQQAQMYKLDNLIREKSYAKALAMINPENIDNQMVSSIIRYDLLNSLVKGSSIKSLKCRSTYEKFSKSPSYSMRICKALIEFQDSGKVKKSSLAAVEEVFELNIFKSDSFLYNALLDLGR